MPDADPSTTPAAPAVPPPTITLSDAQRASLSVKRQALEDKLASLVIAAQPLVAALALDAQQGAAIEAARDDYDAFQNAFRDRQITKTRITGLADSLAKDRQAFEAVVADIFRECRQTLRDPILDHISTQLDALLLPLFSNDTQRRAVLRQSDPYRSVQKVFGRSEYFSAPPIDQLLTEAAAWLGVADRLLSGNSIFDLALPGTDQPVP